MALSTPERNRYFYGKLLDVEQLEKEQRYFNGKRWLLNRLVTGSGVVCGLNVVPGEDDEVVILPGVAIDALGREIIVAEAHFIDPRQLTDNAGNPAGEPLAEEDAEEIEICLAYSETQTDPVPVLVPDCDTSSDGCAHSTIREEYVVLVRRAGELPEPTECGLTEFPLPVDGELDARVCQRLRHACQEEPDASADACVPLARVTLPLSDDSIHPCEGAAVVYNNRFLYELLLCLAGRVTALSRGLILRYAFGDNQRDRAGQTLSEPLGVELVDGEGNPAPDVTVEFEVLRGDGRLGRSAALRDAAPGSPLKRRNPSLSVKTNKKGHASVKWTLGPKPIAQEVIARAVGTPLTVTFRATAMKPE